MEPTERALARSGGAIRDKRQTGVHIGAIHRRPRSIAMTLHNRSSALADHVALISVRVEIDPYCADGSRIRATRRLHPGYERRWASRREILQQRWIGTNLLRRSRER